MHWLYVGGRTWGHTAAGSSLNRRMLNDCNLEWDAFYFYCLTAKSWELSVSSKMMRWILTLKVGSVNEANLAILARLRKDSNLNIAPTPLQSQFSKTHAWPLPGDRQTDRLSNYEVQSTLNNWSCISHSCNIHRYFWHTFRFLGYYQDVKCI